jgi:hypothetical protein
MQTVGTYLRKEREAKNITLGEVAQLTKISEFYLKFLEKDDYEKLPQGPYIKGYISSYARLIGSNPDEALKLYNALQEQMSPAEADDPEEPETATKPALIPSLGEKIGMSMTRWAACVKAKTASFKHLVPAPRSIVTPLRRIPSALGTAGSRVERLIPSAGVVKSVSVPTVALVQKSWRRLSRLAGRLKTSGVALAKAGRALHVDRRLFNWRACVLTVSALIGPGVLALAGFGFYHLFVFENSQTAVVALQSRTDDNAATPAVPEADTDNLPPVRDLSKAATMPAGSPPLPALVETPAALKSAPPTAPVAEPTREMVMTPGLAPPPRGADGESADTTALPQAPVDKPTVEARPAATDTAPESARTPAPPSPPTARSAALNISETSICHGVEDRMPTGISDTFPWSVPRVYIWSLVESKTFPTEIRHIYYYNGQKVSDVALTVRSSYWRTWSYQTIASKNLKGLWQVDIATADGRVLRRLGFTVN